MTIRRPIVNVSGDTRELPTGDALPTNNLTTTARDALGTPPAFTWIFNTTTGQPEFFDGTQWYNFANEPSLSAAQIMGFTTGNAAEVEATKAVRVTMRPPDVFIPTFSRSQYAIGTDALAQNATTLAGTDQAFFQGQWSSHGLAIIRKITVSIWTSALAGTRNGTVAAKLMRAGNLVGLGAFSALTPDGSAQSPTAGRYTQGLTIQQALPMLNVGVGINAAPSGLVADTNPEAVIYGECKNAIGTHLQNAVLFEAKAGETPLILTKFTGFYCTISYPAAGTSQTINAQFNMRWDEVVPFALSEAVPF